MQADGIEKHIYDHRSVLNRSSNCRREEGWCRAESPSVGLGRCSLSSVPCCPLGHKPSSGLDSAIWAVGAPLRAAQSGQPGRHQVVIDMLHTGSLRGLWKAYPAFLVFCFHQTDTWNWRNWKGVTLTSTMKFCQSFHLKKYWFRHTPKIIAVLF